MAETRIFISSIFFSSRKSERKEDRGNENLGNPAAHTCGSLSFPASSFLQPNFLFPVFFFLFRQTTIMPIHVSADIRRMDDEEFKSRAYEVMRHVFDVQRELGRLFHEKIYEREVAYRIPDAHRQVPVEVSFEGFSKTYYLDLLVGGGAIFEMKVVESIMESHRRQLLHYLFLTGLPHGKLVNLRPRRVEHEFVNNALTFSDRTSFAPVGDDWQEWEAGSLKEGMVAVLRDWGTGLDVGLYEEVAEHVCGQMPGAEAEVEIRLGGRCLGVQRMRLASPGVAIRVTALPLERYAEYRSHLALFLKHAADLRAIQWINITRPLVQFETVFGNRK